MSFQVQVLLIMAALTFSGQFDTRVHAASADVAVQTRAGAVVEACRDTSAPSGLREALSRVCVQAPAAIENVRNRNVIIVGFVGGFVPRDDPHHPEVLFASYLRERYGSAVHAEVFGNHEGKRALDDILKLLDTDRDGSLTEAEKRQAEIILYGHSWGASQVIVLAREMEARGIPVALTVQIDSVNKLGQGNHTIPPNVAEAVNFYQRKGLTPGRANIVAEDASRTKILGNFRMTYDDRQVNCDNYKWISRTLNRPHHQIENDPRVWGQIASFIDSELVETRAIGQAASPAESTRVK
jgi:hypothetical protein